MNMNGLIIITDERRVGGMLNAAKALGGQVVAAVVGPRSLADAVSVWGFDRVLCLEPAPDVPAEAYAAQFAEAVMAAAPRVVLASDVPVSRILLGAVAAKLNAAVVASVRALAADGDNIVVSRSTAEGRVWEDIEVQGTLAAIFDGEDVEASAVQPAAVELIPADESGIALRLVKVLESEGGDGLLTARRVVSAGAGLGNIEDLKLIEELAVTLGAEVGCSLPVCEDLRWLPAHQVVGSSHNQVAPELYIAVAISGQPQHMAGIRDAKVVVAINNDPEARILKHCNYGIVGDAYKIVPALITALKNAN